MPSIVHVNRRLTDISLHFPYEYESIGDLFFPTKPVDYLSDQFLSFNKANLLSIRDATPLGDDELPSEVQIVLDPDTTYNAQIYGLSAPGKWVTKRNSDPALDFDTERVIQLTLSLRNRLEYLKVKQRLRDGATTMAAATSTCTALMTQKIDANPATALPINMLKGRVINIRNNNGGRGPNVIAMASEVLNAIAETTDFKNRVQYTVIPDGVGDTNGKLGFGQTSTSTSLLLEAMIGVPRGTIKIADHTYNSAASNQTPVYKKFIGSDIVMAYVEPLGLRGFSFAAGFQWSAIPGSPTSIISVPQYTRGALVEDEYRIVTAVDPKVIKPELGYLITACVDTAANPFLD